MNGTQFSARKVAVTSKSMFVFFPANSIDPASFILCYQNNPPECFLQSARKALSSPSSANFVIISGHTTDAPTAGSHLPALPVSSNAECPFPRTSTKSSTSELVHPANELSGTFQMEIDGLPAQSPPRQHCRTVVPAR